MAVIDHAVIDRIALSAAIADIQRPADDQPVRGDGEVDREGRSALHHAALAGNLAAVRDLLRRGSVVNAADRAGFTPLHFAAQNQHAGLVPVLADAGAEVDARDAWGDTPLFRAVFHSNGDGDTIKALLAVGADPDAANLTGRSPRSLAATIANYDVAKFLT